MLTLDDAGTAEDLAKVWGRRPHVFRNAMPRPVFEATDFFSGVVATAQAMLNGQSKPTGRLALNGKSTSIDEALSFIPRSHIQSFEQYEEQIRESFRDKEFSIILDNVDVALPNIRKRVSPFMHSLFKHVGYPVRGIHSCVYAGNYASTPFGIHMDDCHVIMTAGIGRKTVAFWPREYFEHRRDLMIPGSMAHIQAKVSDHIDDAVVLEIGPLDLLYWPAGYWHVGISDAKDFHAALSIGIYHKGNAAGIIKDAVALPPVANANSGLPSYDSLDMDGIKISATNASAVSMAPQRFTDMWNEVRAGMLSENAAEIAYLKHTLSTITSVGFGPPVLESPGAIQHMAGVAIGDSRFLAWQNVADTTVVASHGLLFEFRSNPDEINALFLKIKRGEETSFTEIAAFVPTERLHDLWAFIVNGGLLRTS